MGLHNLSKGGALVLLVESYPVEKYLCFGWMGFLKLSFEVFEGEGGWNSDLSVGIQVPEIEFIFGFVSKRAVGAHCDSFFVYES